TDKITLSGGSNDDVVLGNDGLDNGGNQITNVASGLDGTDLDSASGDILTNAANIGDLQQATNDITDAGLDFVGDDGTTVHRDLGDTLGLTGGQTDSNE